MLREFWWENVIFVRGVLLLGKDDVEVKKYELMFMYKFIGFVIVKSISLVVELKLVCREIVDYVEFF